MVIHFILIFQHLEAATYSSGNPSILHDHMIMAGRYIWLWVHVTSSDLMLEVASESCSPCFHGFTLPMWRVFLHIRWLCRKKKKSPSEYWNCFWMPCIWYQSQSSVITESQQYFGLEFGFDTSCNRKIFPHRNHTRNFNKSTVQHLNKETGQSLRYGSSFWFKLRKENFYRKVSCLRKSPPAHCHPGT